MMDNKRAIELLGDLIGFEEDLIDIKNEDNIPWYVEDINASDYDEALKVTSEELCRLLMNITGWDKTDTYMYMSIQSDVQINQACKPCSLFLDLRFGTPKIPGLKPLIG